MSHVGYFVAITGRAHIKITKGFELRQKRLSEMVPRAIDSYPKDDGLRVVFGSNLNETRYVVSLSNLNMSQLSVSIRNNPHIIILTMVLISSWIKYRLVSSKTRCLICICQVDCQDMVVLIWYLPSGRHTYYAVYEWNLLCPNLSSGSWYIKQLQFSRENDIKLYEVSQYYSGGASYELRSVSSLVEKRRLLRKLLTRWKTCV